MHRIATTPGGWTPDTEGVIFLAQSPAPLVFLTAADTDIQVLAAALPHLPPDFPALRVANLLNLQQQLTVDTYAEEVLAHAQGIVLRLLGGQAYWSYGLEVVKQTVEKTGAALFVLPGDDRPDPDLCRHSTVPLGVSDRLWRYCTEGGLENLVNGLKFLADSCLSTHFQPPLPQPVPRVGRYEWRREAKPTTPETWKDQPPLEKVPEPEKFALYQPKLNHSAEKLVNLTRAKVGILFYRAHYLAANLAPIASLCQALADRGLEPVPLFVSSLRDEEVQKELLDALCPAHEPPIQVLLNATSFSLARLEAESPQVEFWQRLDVPVIQVILSGGTQEHWQTQTRGLSPRDVAMNVALPEVDGRIIGRAVSFKAVQRHHPALQTDVVGYEPVGDRIQFTADLAANWVKLRQTEVGDRRIALILANYPTRDARLANGVGLDTPASCVEILKAMQQAGYTLGQIPQSADELIQWLTQGITNDPEGRELRRVQQSLSAADYRQWFGQLPSAVQQGITDRWGQPDFEDAIAIAGIQLGNVFVGIQPARGYDLDPTLNYHAPDLEPPHAYLAFYHWLRDGFGVEAIAHLGKHGNLEWLPGKSIALSQDCYPEVALGALPHLYPFIVNDPGEGAQAKRRAQAVILDHLTPPMTRAELYGGLQQLEGLIDEYYEAQSLNPSRLGAIRDRISTLIQQEHLNRDISPILASDADTDWTKSNSPAFASFVTQIDGYLCELKEAQIRDGLHIFGQCPEGRQLRDLIVAIARHPGAKRLGITRAIAQDWQLDFDPLTADLSHPWNPPAAIAQRPELATCRTLGDVVEVLEQTAADGVAARIQPIHSIQPRAEWDESLDESLDESTVEMISESLNKTSKETTVDKTFGEISGEATGETSGQLTGKITGQVLGETLGKAFEETTGEMLGETSGQVTGQVTGEITGQVPGKTLGEISGETLGETIGQVTGKITGQVPGKTLGEISGKALGETTGQVTGEITGQVPGETLGKTSGKTSGKTTGETIELALGETTLEGEDGRSHTLQELPHTHQELHWIEHHLLPNLRQTPQEIRHFLHGLDGGYIPSGASGAPTRGRPEVLPTGRNFYSVDIRAIPTESAWDVGRKAAERLIEQYTQEQGEYPKTLALSIWGTSTMRTGGDDLAEALALLGVQPVWDGAARRVIDFEILPLSVLGRPRVDVTLRISGFFRDAFPNLIDLFHQAVAAVAALNEPLEQNPLAAQVQQDSLMWQEAGLSVEEAGDRAQSRIFGSKPGAYGAGLQGLIDAQNWTTDADLAQAYLNWSCYAYRSNGSAEAMPEAFEQRLRQLQIVLHNQDNREHDLLDSDDYYQFQGGLTVAVRSLTGQNPRTYFGDNSLPENPKIRTLQAEINRVYRSRVVNPKWIAGVMRHGYKGAFEMAATVDYLFAYDATAQCVEDHMYQGVAEAYLLDETVHSFIQQKNPWALRDMAERLLEANQRGMWQQVNPETLEALRAIANRAEGEIEQRTLNDLRS
ncbi:MAG: cobaltochelatase subunit CobN [Oculatellaceae cyanobacterium Prado106]|jgi:cobaltochelatase CobN|nr:cobaltochelatase subunit CobN [Oculatellaceae cyanobacterium Prado106]